MQDIAEINDPTPPEEYERRMLERAAQVEQRQQERTSEHLADVHRQVQSGVEKELRLTRIEEKLDKILSILESRA